MKGLRFPHKLTKPPVEGGGAEAVDEHDGFPGALLDVVNPAAAPRPEVVPVRFERQNLQPCTHDRRNRVPETVLNCSYLTELENRVAQASDLARSRWRRPGRWPSSRRRRARSRPWSPAPSSASSRTCRLPMAGPQPQGSISLGITTTERSHELRGLGGDEGTHR